MTTNRTFIPREHLRIALSKEEISVVDGWHEASVTKVLNSGEKLVAWVPLHSLGDDQSWVPSSDPRCGRRRYLPGAPHREY